MARRWNRIEIAVGVVVAGIGAILMFVAGLWIYMSANARPIYPAPADVPMASQAAPAQNWAAAATRARDIVRAHVADKNLPAVSVAVGVGTDLVWSEAFGLADLEKKRPVTTRTQFRIGTTSTLLTSAAAGLLLEQNRLKLDEPIQTYIQEFPRKEWPVTLRQVMSHTAGLSADGGDEGALLSQQCTRPVEALHEFADRKLRSQPGTEYHYPSYGWILVSAAIESASNEPFLLFMQKQIFQKLNMNDTGPDSKQSAGDRATSYFPKFAGDPRYGNDVMRDIDLSCYAGSSVFVSTASDLVRFALAIQNGTLLQRTTVESLQAGQKLESGKDTGYGLGWDLESVDLGGTPARMVGHDGDVLGGIVSSVMTFPDRGLSVAVIANTSYSDVATLATKIAQQFRAP